MKTDPAHLPVAIIGAGPVGLAAAAHLIERGEQPLVLESGPSIGHSVRKWGHVRMFSPWHYNIDSASRRLLEAFGWDEPCGERLPTGRELVGEYLEPLASIKTVADSLRLSHRVIFVTRDGIDKVRSHNRAAHPFVLRTVDSAGHIVTHRAKAVIDASGTWDSPNPMGADGLPVPGEELCSSRIDYGIPDMTGPREADFAGADVLVVGSGHSSFNAVLNLLHLKEKQPDTMITWAMRKTKLGNVFGGGTADALPERGELGQKVREAVDCGAVKLLNPMTIEELTQNDSNSSISVHAKVAGDSVILSVDRVVVATGFRPDLSFSREIRLRLDSALECAGKLGPLIDPNEHSCGSVPPHGAAELAHPEPGYYIVGMKSYGRAPTFLLATGYQQVRSVVAEIAGDHEAAAKVHLDLPETGVCHLSEEGKSVSPCCGDQSKDAESSPVPDGGTSTFCCG
ncbi:MAG: NAD(P)-binding domain-containing protein [Verrucomicrobiales bacterium]|nr:NAD(P)-binding domain-containing protein [Verrucomicrobiales bacterium]